jgi:hypothetical protein
MLCVCARCLSVYPMSPWSGLVTGRTGCGSSWPATMIGLRVADIVRLEVELRRDVGRAKWVVWHGNIHDALELLAYTMFGLEGCARNNTQVKTVKLVDEMHGYLQRNQGSIPVTPNSIVPVSSGQPRSP